MNADNFKQLLDQALDPIKKQLDNPDTGLKRINEKLDSHSVSLIEIEGTLKGYADSYKTNKGNIRRLDARVSELEEREGIILSPDLAIQR